MKVWTPTPTDEALAGQLQLALGISPLFCRLLVQRGIHSFDEARRFFRPELIHLHDPFQMKDMEPAVQRLHQAIIQQEKILLYGDYDVDGTTSVALMYSFLGKYTEQLDYYIPDRYKEGYGISYQGIDYAVQNGIALIIAMDCGIRALRETDYAQGMGVDMIICDHHLPGEKLPAARAVLDPKRADCDYPYKELSGCGVAFKLAQAYTERYQLEWADLSALLDLLVISIASDIVPITGENRVLAYHGLRQLNNTPRLGLQALIAQSRRTLPLHISDLVFGLGPMINAAGRLADAGQAVELMLAQDTTTADAYAKVLNHRNQLRREFDQRTAEEAGEIFRQAPDWEHRSSLVVYEPHWHKGVIGIVASRMAEAFFRPSVVLTLAEGKIVGSARSVNGFDIHDALLACEDLLISFGGHNHAAGLSLSPENLFAFQDRFEAVVYTRMQAAKPENQIPVAAELALADITPGFWRLLDQFAPFGPGNRNPVFVSRGVVDTGYSRILKNKHLRLSIRQGDATPFLGIAFGRAADFAAVSDRKPFDICYTIQENEWKGKRDLQLVIKDLL